MSLMRDRRTSELIDAYAAGRLSRRGFVSRLLALGLAPAVAGAVLAEAGARTASAQASSVPKDVSGEMRFMIGPWTDQEVEHQQTIAAAFNQTYPNVKFTFKLFSWDSSGPEIDASLADGSHDIYYFGEGAYLARAKQGAFADLTERINDPAWADEKAKYLYWDRLAAYGDKLIGLPICWHVEDALFVNLDKAKEVGHDATFVDTWDGFVDCVTKMTKGDETYGLGMGMQLGNFAEWYQRARSAGGRFLTEDLSKPAINTPDVVIETQHLVDFFQKGIAPPLGTFNYDTAPDAFIAGRLATYSSDLTIAAVLMGKPKPPAFEWAVLPWPPGVKERLSFNDIGLYGMNAKTPNPDLAWEVLKFWTSGPQGAYWTAVSGTYPARSDALDFGFAEKGVKQLADSFEQFQKFSVGPEPFLQWGTIETQAGQQAAQAYSGEISAQDAVTNIEQIVNQEVFG